MRARREVPKEKVNDRMLCEGTGIARGSPRATFAAVARQKVCEPRALNYVEVPDRVLTRSCAGAAEHPVRHALTLISHALIPLR
ncbi:unnamed protein product [Pieris brassicae]|uniref:Uncharacterized protein n=1 Tax=Pieris brassicae TaxID=7116 RepID=A0A9P0XCW1_PIEBR|nr:unnamed protein product [Pieris brassicae]